MDQIFNAVYALVTEANLQFPSWTAGPLDLASTEPN
jgi:hypothetical protein